MAVDYTATKLVRDVRNLILLPNTPNTYDDDSILQIMTDQLQSFIVPLYMSFRQEYLVETHTLSYSTTSAEYYIPPTSINAELRDFAMLDQNSNPSYRNLIDPSDIKSVGISSSYSSGANGLYPSYYIQNDKIILWWGNANTIPSGSTWTGVKFSTYRMPNVLVGATQAAKITSITDNVLVVNSVPNSWDVGTKVDFIKGTGPIFSAKGVEKIDGWEITVLSGSVVTFAEVPSNLVVGDWLSEVGTSPIPMIPYSAFPLLVAATAEMLIGPGLSHPKAAMVAKVKETRAQALSILMKRNDAQPQQLRHRDGIGRNR